MHIIWIYTLGTFIIIIIIYLFIYIFSYISTSWKHFSNKKSFALQIVIVVTVDVVWAEKNNTNIFFLQNPDA